MKIIKVDNFDKESIPDVLIAENVHKFYVKIIVDFLNEKYSYDMSPIFYKAVDDNYKLRKYIP